MSDIKIIEDEINNIRNQSLKITENMTRISNETVDIGANILC